MENIDFSKCIIHDSTKELYRKPMGAQPCGTSVEIRLTIKDLFFQSVYLVTLHKNKKSLHEMHNFEGNLVVEFDAPAKPGVVWYYFAIKLTDNTRLYYGATPNITSGLGKAYFNEPPAFQLTVFDANFITPNWFKKAIMYQIFPDRFHKSGDEDLIEGAKYHKSKNRSVRIHESWDEFPEYMPVENKKFYEPCDYFGGNLKGIMEYINYLCELGITVIYLNPIFEAASNHRYNTSDYLKIDPILGTNEDFEKLVKECKERGIEIILDGVFSHTGDDSVYFNKYGNYEEVGAYQSKDSKYFNWYNFIEHPNSYKSWWGFETLPEIIEQNQDWVDFVIENDDSVIKTWLKKGASGYRLDVADELPDKTIEQIRDAIKSVSQDKVLLGEVWEDATTKESYGETRQYAFGKGLDTVMNYPLKTMIIDFLNYHKNAYDFKRFLVNQQQNYPKEMYYCLMNLLSSHDIARVRTLLATKINAQDLTIEQQAHFIVTKEQDKLGEKLQKIAVALQFALPGVPSIYYGDEVGMHGLRDPFNRQTFTNKDCEIKDFYKSIASIRNKETSLQTGKCIFFVQDEDVLSIMRFCIGGKDAFENITNDKMIITVVNRSEESKQFAIDLYGSEQLYEEEDKQFFKDVEFVFASCMLTGNAFELNFGLLQGEIEPYSALMINVEWI